MSQARDNLGRFVGGGKGKDFNKQVGGFASGTAAKLQNFRRGVTIAVFSAVIQDTPVDTGRARGNWRVSEGQPQLNPVDREDKSGEVPKGEILTLVSKSQGDKPVFLANNLPYAEPLENGHSKQAPAGMVRKNVARFQSLVNQKLAQA
jgi:hypothetical protein